MVELLLQAYPNAVCVKDHEQCAPLDLALERVEKTPLSTTQLAASDELIALLKAGG